MEVARFFQPTIEKPKNGGLTNNKMNTAITAPPPRRKDEIAINAGLLYLYVGHPELSFNDWTVSLHSLSGQLSRYRLMTGDDGKLALNAEFAALFAYQVARDLMGAIAWILIDEGRSAAQQGDADYTNRALNRFQVLAVARGQMHAETLHAFLQVEQTYQQWFAQLKKEHGIVYGTDYRRWIFDGKNRPKVPLKDTGKGDVIFGPRFAMKVAAAEPTRRGELVRRCFEISYVA